MAHVVLTDRDRAVLGDLVRFGVLSASQIQRRHFGGSRNLGTTWNRLRRLQAGGYVRRLPLGHRDAAYLATAAGAHAAGLGLPPLRHQGGSAVALRHAMTVADVAEHLLTQRYQHGTPAWISEREFRQGRPFTGAPPASGIPCKLPVSTAVGGGWPDGVLVLTGPDGVEWRLAVEVELTQKSARLYATKIAFYRQLLVAGSVARVRWYAATPAIGRAIEHAVRDSGGSSLITTEPFLPA